MTTPRKRRREPGPGGSPICLILLGMLLVLAISDNSIASPAQLPEFPTFEKEVMPRQAVTNDASPIDEEGDLTERNETVLEYDDLPGGATTDPIIPSTPEPKEEKAYRPFEPLSEQEEDFLGSWKVFSEHTTDPEARLKAWQSLVLGQTMKSYAWPLTVFLCFSVMMILLCGLCCCKKSAIFCLGQPFCDTSKQAAANYSTERQRRDSFRQRKRGPPYSLQQEVPAPNSWASFPAPSDVGVESKEQVYFPHLEHRPQTLYEDPVGESIAEAVVHVSGESQKGEGVAQTPVI